MRMAFRNLKELPKNFKFIADGYSAYPLAAQQFFHEFGDKFKFSITQVIGLTNDDEVSKEFRPYKQMIERLNRTYKVSYRPTNGFDNIDGANYDLALWVAYYNFFRPHKHTGYKVLNEVELLKGAEPLSRKPWNTSAPHKDMPRKVADIRVLGLSCLVKRGQLRFSCLPARDGFRQSLILGQGTSPLRVLRQRPRSQRA